jgi:hypothetical protein
MQLKTKCLTHLLLTVFVPPTGKTHVDEKAAEEQRLKLIPNDASSPWIKYQKSFTTI